MASAAPADQANHQGAGDRDFRPGQRGPSSRQRDLAARQGVTARWNKLGTPAILVPQGQALATGLAADPATAARAYLSQQRELLGVSQQAVDSLEVVAVNPIGAGSAVLFRERFGDLPAGYDGLAAVGVAGGKVYMVNSTLAPDVSTPEPATLTETQALRNASSDTGLNSGTVTSEGSSGGWSRFTASGLQGTQSVKLVAVPLPQGGARSAYEVSVNDSGASGAESYTSYVDARTGDVLIREDNVADDAENPEWKAFPENPPADYSSRDTRETWCLTRTAGCDRVIANAASPLPWDVDPSVSATESTQTTRGNNEWAAQDWLDATGRGFNLAGFATPRPDRNYTYPWTNQWYKTKCDPSTFDSPQRNDIDAADANLLAMHNRMHDFSYNLGFTESAWNLQDDNFGKGGLGADPEHGNSQSGARVPGSLIRDNANQATPPDGNPPTTNMYLWQSIAGSFYSPCVDGDYDQSVIGHEYTHAISNRMVAGPDRGLTGFQAGAMGESWSDLDAMEYLAANGLVPAGQSAFVTGQYVTGNKVRGIRDYDLSKNPLNYSDLGFDLTGPEVHADGEIWNGVNYDLRQAFIAKYGAGSAALRRSCAEGRTPVTRCPGDRRWIQLVYDGWLLMANGAVSMLDARDAMLAADQMRFGGADQALLWNTFAHRGMGSGAASNTNADSDATPGFSSPTARNATVRFTAVDDTGAPVQGARFFVGDYQARAVPVADGDAATALPDTASIVAGSYTFVAQAPGHGMTRFTARLSAGSHRTVKVKLARNVASAAGGATASGDGVDLGSLIDDDEATTWAYLGAQAAPLDGRGVTVKLAGTGPQQVRRVQVSALLRPANAQDPGGDTQTQNRFTALRSFRLLACKASATVDCSQAKDYHRVFTSPRDAFPAAKPRPVAPNLTMRSFSIPKTTATHLRFEVVASQCSGNPDYAGQQTNDPNVPTDCVSGSAISGQVRAADFQAFTR
ncbi:M36 family metallopeptidase [Actinomadura sp. DC4]|uniref:M36 family metallopeptidase n=1 Tax=Actinomadura sp. DC4 TaxID=3055069 RepID=UPI0025B1C407|nr:M36 family metallopeptidase [Actinomadura sp. DC4]MDN3358711.1 M36 family metallopeptidase [Actinomadura sp. DC4]